MRAYIAEYRYDAAVPSRLARAYRSLSVMAFETERQRNEWCSENPASDVVWNGIKRYREEFSTRDAACKWLYDSCGNGQHIKLTDQQIAHWISKKIEILEG